jgi:hypothetical protein
MHLHTYKPCCPATTWIGIYKNPKNSCCHHLWPSSSLLAPAKHCTGCRPPALTPGAAAAGREGGVTTAGAATSSKLKTGPHRGKRSWAAAHLLQQCEEQQAAHHCHAPPGNWSGHCTTSSTRELWLTHWLQCSRFSCYKHWHRHYGQQMLLAASSTCQQAASLPRMHHTSYPSTLLPL